MDYSILKQEEREWLSKAIIDNMDKKGLRKERLRENWKLRMNEEEIESWKRQQNRYYLQFDGASKNNPGKARAGGIIFYPSGKKIITYEWGLGQISNNKAEAYNLFLGTKIIKKKMNSKSNNHGRLSHHN